MKVVILYMELAGYMVSSIHAFANRKVEHSVLLVHLPVNPEAPFEFGVHPDVENIPFDRRGLGSTMQRIDEFRPDVILCSGWIFKDYLRVCKKYYGKIPTVLCMDNVYEGNWKQAVLRRMFRIRFSGCFSDAWVPGPPQERYAAMLGFAQGNIHRGLYTADTAHFTGIYESNKSSKRTRFPKKFICVARYIPEKNLETLWKAFIRLVEEGVKDWELWCLGSGVGFDSRAIHPKIHHRGFVQPENMPEVLAQTGIFVLPSVSEPWGVATHEMALSGFPLLVSNRVGSTSLFLAEGENGFSFDPMSTDELLAGMRKMVKLSDEELDQMSSRSHQLAMQVSTNRWGDTLEHIANSFVTSSKR